MTISSPTINKYITAIFFKIQPTYLKMWMTMQFVRKYKLLIIMRWKLSMLTLKFTKGLL